MWISKKKYEMALTENRQLREALSKKVDDSIKDPLFMQIRILMSDEITQIKDQAMVNFQDESNMHRECARTILLLVRNIVGQSN